MLVSGCSCEGISIIRFRFIYLSTPKMFDGCDKSILAVVGNSACGFIAANDEIKNKVDSKISTLYIYAFDSGISDSLRLS